MRSVVLSLVAACGFSGASSSGDANDACVPEADWWDAAWQQRLLVDTANAPDGYTLRLDAAAILATSLAPDARDIRAVVRAASGFRELDRVVDPPFVELRAPASGELWLYSGNAEAAVAPSDRAAVFAFAEDFDALPVGDNGGARFDPQPAAEWSVVDEGGDHYYRARGGGRHPAAFRGLAAANGELRARLRVDATGTQNHNGLVARSASLVPLSMDGFVGQVLEDSDRTRIAEYRNGQAPVEMASLNRAVDASIWYVLRLRFVGTTIEVYVDGALEAKLENAPPADGELLGLFVHDCDVVLDDVWLRLASDPEPPASIGTIQTRCP